MKNSVIRLINWNTGRPELTKFRCDYCGTDCELAFTTGHCCPCFEEGSTADLAWCFLCIKRFEKVEARKEWFKEHRLTLDQFIY